MYRCSNLVSRSPLGIGLEHFYFMKTWGFIRETSELAKKAGIDTDTKLPRTGLNEYLKVIFPNVNDWVHDKVIPNSNLKRRPDYRSETLKLIVEFDGLNHYTDPVVIKRDEESIDLYTRLGYKVVRIPYFVQLSNSAVKKLFGSDVIEPLFDETVPSLSISAKNTPAFLCHAGVERMAREFKNFPIQYETNIKYLEKVDNDYLTGLSLLKGL